MGDCRERFLCDEMLMRLGRWLRAAGYDVVIASEGESDKNLLKQAMDEQRQILTRDRKLLEHHGAPTTTILLQGNLLSEQFQELSEHSNINWLCQPFSRCLQCNTPLVEASAETIAEKVPQGILREGESVLYCSECDKAYWYGSHVKRMRNRLEQLSLGVWNMDVEETVLPEISETDERNRRT